MQIEPIAHHPYGPSRLENYDPKSGGCSAFIPNPESNEKAEFGTLKHQVFASGEYELLGGDTQASAEVARVLEFANQTRGEYPVVHNELTLKTEKIFGTIDWLGMNQERTHGIIIDAKFGVWTVTTAKKNLQGWAYVLLAFNNFPTLNKIKVIFYAAKTGLHSKYTFWRYRLPALEKRIYRIIDRAIEVEKAPTEKDYTPNAVNCSFCTRLACPARLALMGTLVTVWTGKPVELPHLDLLKVSTPQLAALKRLSNVFAAFKSAVDAEAKRRAFSGDIIEGYEIAEKSGTRTVAGTHNITVASGEILRVWKELGWDLSVWDDYIADNIEFSVSDLEKEIQKLAPYGKGAMAKKIITQALESAGLVNASSVFYLRAIKE